MNYESALKKLRAQEFLPRSALWSRIENTLDGQAVHKWKQQLVFSASALAVFAVLTFSGAGHYNNYRLEQYLLSSCDYPVYTEYFGTFI